MVVLVSLLRVATFNVNSIRSRLPVLERWLHDTSVDVLCLQETKVVDGDFPRAFFEDLGYGVAFRGQKAYSGVAVASRLPIEEAEAGFGDGGPEGDEHRILRVTLGVPGSVARPRLRVVNTYVPQGKAIDHPDYPYKLAFLERLARLFDAAGVPEGHLLWVGDLNVAPTDRDVTHPENKRDHVCFHETLRNLFADIAAPRFVDVFRKHRPGNGEFSFWDYRVKNALERNIGWRIDHILATPELAALSSDCYAVRELRAWEKPSDHTAVVGVFDL
jgi:exodeoxyribonuclease-3